MIVFVLAYRLLDFEIGCSLHFCYIMTQNSNLVMVTKNECRKRMCFNMSGRHTFSRSLIYLLLIYQLERFVSDSQLWGTLS